MATQTQRIYNNNYKLGIYQGDKKVLNVGVFTNFYRDEAKDLSGYTCYMKTDNFTIEGTVYGDDNNSINFTLSSTETNIRVGTHPYEIYIVDGSSNRETVLQDNLEIINII
jgi:hypothetical protein